MNAKSSKEASEAMSVVPAGIRELLEQRGTYREWLERLDEVGGQYRPEVARRVRSDYQQRLDGVAEQLEGHRNEIVSTLDQRRGRLGELSDGFERRSAELEEAELRFQVGEFDDVTWEEKRGELTEGLEEIEGELNDERAAVEELERVLHDLSSGAPAGAAEEDGPPQGVASRKVAEVMSVDELRKAFDSPPPDEAEPVAQEVEPEPRMEEPEAEEAAAPEPELDAEGSTSRTSGREEAAVAGSASPGPAAEEEPVTEADSGVDEPAADEQPEAAADEDYMDELEFLESLSLDDPDSFDAVSRMLEDEEDR